MLEIENKRYNTFKKLKKYGIFIRSNIFQKKDHSHKLFNRNCISGKKYKFYSINLSSLRLIHIFLFFYGKKVKNKVFWKSSIHLFLRLYNFFFFNSPYLAIRKRIIKRKPNKLTLYYIEKHRRSAEIFKWFFILSYKQPFTKVYQRCAFLMLDFIFFEHKNIFAQLAKQIDIQRFTSVSHIDVKRQKKLRRRFKRKIGYIGKIKNI